MASDLEIKSIRQAIDVMAAAQEEKEFLIGAETGDFISFQQLRSQSIALAAALRSMGLEAGDKAAFLMDNGLKSAQIFLATMYGGYVAVPLNVRAGVVQLTYMLDHCDAKVVFAAPQYFELLHEALGGVQRTIRVIETSEDAALPSVDSGREELLPPPPAGEDVAMLMYSSGSTGKPKAAIHTHSSILAHGRNSIQSHRLTAKDRSLLVLPLYHINAECVTLIPTLLSAGSVVVTQRFAVTRFWDWIEDYRVTWSALVPTIISELVDWDDPGKDHRAEAFARIRFFRSSSAPLSPTLHQQFLDKFQLPLIQAMGSTEGGNVFSNPVPPGVNKIGSPGLPWGFEARIVNREGADVPRGQSGEVVLRGAALMRSYYKDTEGTAAVLDSEGWFHTGDLARQDEDGYFFIVGRSKELIIKGGVNIAPRQIDEVLESHPAVLEAAAVGIPDRYFGEDAVAFVVLRQESAADERELLSFCETRLGHFKTPSRLHFLKELPKGPSGKVQRLRLLDPEILSTVAAANGHDGAAFLSRGDLAGSGSFQSAAASIEQILAAAWAEVLNLPEVDTETNFFALGGHSLLAIQCLSKLRTKLPVVVSLSDFFENSTVAEQARFVRQQLHGANGKSDPSSADSQNWEESLLKQYVPAAQESIPRLDSTLPHPLSLPQQRVWFMEKLNPDVPVYNESEAVLLTGNLDAAALEKAFNVIIARHEALRSTIQVIDGVPHVIIHQDWPLRFKQIDLTRLAPDERQSELDRLLIDEPRIPYRLETEPGIRIALIRLSAREHVLILCMHHIICDWSSEGIIWRELSALYRACLSGEQADLPVLPVTHRDYVVWQQKRVDETDFSADIAFWEENLKGAPALLELPTDRPRPAVMSYQGKRLRWRLSADLTGALRTAGQQERTSLFTIFAAALDAVFYRYTGSTDILLGLPIADRDLAELQSTIGFLLHTHVLRTSLSGDISFRELLGRVQKGVLDLYAHRSVPFDQVVRKLQPERNLSYSPLFQVMLNWRDRDQQLSFIGLEGLAVESLIAAADTSKFDLLLFVTDEGDEIWLEAEYNTDIFDQDRIARMLGHYQTVLEAVAADPGVSVAEVPLLTPGEYRQTVVDWNRTQVDFPQEECLVQLIEKQVRLVPDKIAASFGGRQLSYRQLWDRANYLAGHLQKLGVKRGALVAICVERSLDMIVGLLGILRAGAAYLPLDPSFPPERLEFMLQDAQPFILLTQEKLRTLLTRSHTQVVTLDTLPFHNNAPDVAVGHGPDDLAYVLYTSGSTGTPKGVQIQHRALANLLRSMQREPGITADDTMLAITTLSFDIAGLELYLPLTAGAHLVIASSEDTRDGKQLAALMRSTGTSIMQATPATWRMLLDASWNGSPNLTILCGGESWGSELAIGLLSRCKSLWNMYGPTETTIWSLGKRLECGLKQVSIGTPIANTRVYILDGQGEPVPVGIPGELYIGGAGVARGYLNRPELTAEKFVDDPFRGAAGARMYRTGDLARYLADGNIEFLGRNDFQVKLRGFRIELGEIEARLAEHATVREALVIVREDTPGDKRLVAYYTEKASVQEQTGEQQESAVGAEQLRSHLSASLPEYMVPAAYVCLESLPLTFSGKLDRRALPKPEADAYSTRGYEPPQGPIEIKLAQVWAETLKLDRVGRYDNFFGLGGHSLLAMRVATRLRQALSVEVTIRDLFVYPVLADLARALENVAQAELPLITVCDRSKDLPLSFAQQRLWFLAQIEGASEAYHIPFDLRLKGDLDRVALHHAFDRIVARHEALRTTFAIVGDQPVQHIAAPGEAVFHLIEHDLRERQTAQEELAWLTELENSSPFDLETGPLIRGRLIRLADDEHTLLITMHHIVSDGWSMGIFTNELSACYAAFRDDRQALLPVLEIQYADYAVWQRQWIEGEILQRQADYWKTALAGIPALLELPADRPRPAQQDYAGALTDFVLDEKLTAKLKAFSQKHGTTLFMTLLAAWAVLLSRLSGQQDVVIGTPTANRGRAEIENLIGFFVNTLALRLDLSGSPSVSELLKQTRMQVLVAQENQDIPFEEVVELLQPERNLSYSPLFQVMFAWQNNATGTLDLPGIGAERLRFSTRRTSKFDLTLSLAEVGNRIVGGLEFATALFDRSTVEGYLGHFNNLLEAMAADDVMTVDRLPLLSKAERLQLLYAWNATSSEYPSERCVHQLFEAQAEKTPGAVAVVFQAEQLSYAELNQRSNQLAHSLREMGVQPDDRIAICVERGLNMVVGLLAILKAGAAYVPLDPAYPRERLGFMLRDAAPVAVLTQTHLCELLSGLSGAPRIIDLNDASAWQDQPAENPEPAAVGLTPANLAYVIYTSGSTGKPKGVMVEHGNLTNFVCGMQQQLQIDSQTTLLAVTTITFDIAGLEIYLPLTTGACVRILSREAAADGSQLLTELGRGVTMMQATPATWRLLLAAGWQPGNEPLQLLCGGEALSLDLAEKLASGSAEAWNMYGPTETTIWSLGKRLECGLKQVSIGTPIANTRVYILDGQGEPVPVGIPGELYIGGAGVARGYLNRPELTAEKFVDDPFRGAAGARMYRTGDLARYLADGNIEFLGRNDFQVKLRGFRIELGEIEARLLEHPSVREAAVVKREDAAGDERLVAYVVKEGADDETKDAHSLRNDDWREIWEETYRAGETSAPDFNIAGWKSSYTGEQLPPEEMRIWVEETVSRIREFRASRVVEIGCGTGLLLTRLAPGCEKYLGLDFSEEAIAGLREHCSARADLDSVELRHGAAHELAFIEDGSVDLVILNSVAQYFPSLDYLLQVLRDVVRITREGGHIFLGDIRSLPLLEAYHASVQLSRSSAQELDERALRAKIAEAMRNEEELVLDPRLFEELGRGWKRVARAEVSLKSGSYDNELTRFRYDVVLSLGSRQELESPELWLRRDAEGLWRDKVRKLLKERPGSCIGIREIPDRRVRGWIEAARNFVVSENVSGEDPNDLMQFARERGVTFTWQGFNREGFYEFIFNPRWKATAETVERPQSYYRTLANTPSKGTHDKELAHTLREHLLSRLPEYMVPSTFVRLHALPLTANGKVDRTALKQSNAVMTHHGETELLAPRDEIERRLLLIWEQLLPAQPIGIRSSFFELGGHSLLVVRLFAQIKRVFQLSIPIAAIFGSPTIEHLAALIRGRALDSESSAVNVEQSLSQANATIIPLKQGGSNLPLFLIHGGEGHLLGFHQLAKLTAADRPIYGVQAQVFLEGKPALLSVEDQAAYYVEEIQKIQPTGPYFLLGYCYGGLVAGEMAHLLHAQGERVEMLGMLDTRVRSQSRQGYRGASVTINVHRRLSDIRGYLQRISFMQKVVYLPAKVYTRSLRGMYRLAMSLGVRTVPAFLKDPKQIIRVAAMKYRPRPWPGEITVFRASVQPDSRMPSDLGWSSFAMGGVNVCEVPGNHYAVFHEPNIQILAESLRQRLEKAEFVSASD